MTERSLKDYPTYDIASLEKNLEQANANIRLFEEKILEEEDRKRELRSLIQLCKGRDLLIQRMKREAIKARADAGNTKL